MLTYFAENEKQDKAALRRRLLAFEAPAPEIQLRASKQLLQTAEWRNASAIALYASKNGEMDTWTLLRAALAQGKTVLLPRIADLAQKLMLFYPCRHEAELERGPYGICQPRRCGEIASHADLLLLPGLAFDRAGYRLGYGGGYYDRFLAANAAFAPLRIGYCAAERLAQTLPHAPHDIPANGLCTEDGLTCF